MAYEDILYRVDDGVAVITLNRPDRLNAWRGQMAVDVRAAMRAASDDPAVSVIVLTGAGRGFCAGADMNNLQTIQSGDTSARSSAAAAPDAPFDPASRKDFQTANSYFPSVPKPIIGAINGAWQVSNTTSHNKARARICHGNVFNACTGVSSVVTASKS